MIHTIRVLCHRGDDPVTYDPAKPAEVAAAKAAVDRLLGDGWALFAAAPADVGGKRLTAFDPLVEDVIAVPRIVGG